MKIFPAKKIQLETDISVEEVFELLKKNVEDENIFRYNAIGYTKGDPCIFEGKVYSSKFNIKRIPQKRNNFIIEAVGSYYGNSNEGTTLNLLLRTNLITRIFFYSLIILSLVLTFIIFLIPDFPFVIILCILFLAILYYGVAYLTFDFGISTFLVLLNGIIKTKEK